MLLDDSHDGVAVPTAAPLRLNALVGGFQSAQLVREWRAELAETVLDTAPKLSREIGHVHLDSQRGAEAVPRVVVHVEDAERGAVLRGSSDCFLQAKLGSLREVHASDDIAERPRVVVLSDQQDPSLGTLHAGGSRGTDALVRIVNTVGSEVEEFRTSASHRFQDGIAGTANLDVAHHIGRHARVRQKPRPRLPRIRNKIGLGRLREREERVRRRFERRDRHHVHGSQRCAVAVRDATGRLECRSRARGKVHGDENGVEAAHLMFSTVHGCTGDVAALRWCDPLMLLNWTLWRHQGLGRGAMALAGELLGNDMCQRARGGDLFHGDGVGACTHGL